MVASVKSVHAFGGLVDMPLAFRDGAVVHLAHLRVLAASSDFSALAMIIFVAIVGVGLLCAICVMFVLVFQQSVGRDEKRRRFPSAETAMAAPGSSSLGPTAATPSRGKRSWRDVPGDRVECGSEYRVPSCGSNVPTFAGSCPSRIGQSPGTVPASAGYVPPRVSMVGPQVPRAMPPRPLSMSCETVVANGSQQDGLDAERQQAMRVVPPPSHASDDYSSAALLGSSAVCTGDGDRSQRPPRHPKALQSAAAAAPMTPPGFVAQGTGGRRSSIPPRQSPIASIDCSRQPLSQTSSWSPVESWPIPPTIPSTPEFHPR